MKIKIKNFKKVFFNFKAKKEKISNRERKLLKEAEAKKIEEFVHKPLPKKIINKDLEKKNVDINNMLEKSAFKNLETINYKYSSETINSFAEIIFYCEKVNFGNFSLFKIFWDCLLINCLYLILKIYG